MIDRIEVVRLREACAAAARDRMRAACRERPGRRRRVAAATPRSIAARVAEVRRAKAALESFGFAPELTGGELRNVLP